MEETCDVDRISDFPELIIDKILQFLGPRYAAQTSILSKKWREFYTYYPNLDFDHLKFAKYSFVIHPTHRRLPEGKLEKILEERIGIKNFIDVKLRRIYNKKLPLKQFKLSMAFNDDLPNWLDVWIELAVNCQVEMLYVDVVAMEGTYYSLPPIVLASRSIKKLRLKRCLVKCPNTLTIGFCSSLRELELKYVDIDEKTIHNLISNCPLIEYLRLVDCVGFKRLQVRGLHRLKHLVYCSKEVEGCIIEAPSLQMLKYSYSSSRGGQIWCSAHPMLHSTCEYLKRIVIQGVYMNEKYLSNILSRSFCIEDLSLVECNLPEIFMISSLSLKKIVIDHCDNLVEATFDTPSLLSCTYSGVTMPKLSSKSGSDQWVANISTETLDAVWFQKLSRFISNKFQVLNLLICTTKFDFNLEELMGASSLPCLCEMVTLTFATVDKRLLSYATLLDGLLWNIHPSVVQLSLQPYFVDGFLKEWHGRVGEREPSCCSFSYKIRCWRHYLKDVTDVSIGAVEEIPYVELKPYAEQLVVLKFSW